MKAQKQKMSIIKKMLIAVVAVLQLVFFVYLLKDKLVPMFGML